jgi:hypothetical protein
VPSTPVLIVTGVLAFKTEAVAYDPYQRIEPIEHTEQLGRHLHNPVAAPDVRKLVAQDDARAIRRPLGGGRRKNDRRQRQPPCGEQRRMLALQQHKAPLNSIRV